MIKNLEFKPDLPQHGQQIHIKKIEGNALYRDREWIALRSLDRVKTDGVDVAAIPQRVVRAFTFRSKDGVGHIVAACLDGSLYKLQTIGGRLSWRNVFAADGSVIRWEIVLFGDYLYGVNGGLTNPLYRLDLNAGAGTFTEVRHVVSGKNYAPQGMIKIVTARNHVVGIRNGEHGAEVLWSAINNPTHWEPGKDLSDIQLLTDNGRVEEIAGIEDLYVWTDIRAYRMSYTGSPPIIWQIDKIIENRRILGTGAAIPASNSVYYASHDGFYKIGPGGDMPTGVNRVDKLLYQCFDSSKAQLLYCFEETEHGEIWWLYAINEDRINAAFVYNYIEDKWSHLSKLEGPYFDGHLSNAVFTIGGLAKQLQRWSEIPNNLILSRPISLGYVGGVLSAFDKENHWALPQGDGEDVTLKTSMFEVAQGSRQFIRAIRPYSDSQRVDIEIETTEYPNGQIDVLSVDGSFAPTGSIGVSASGRYAAVGFAINGPWSVFQGFEIDSIRDGIQ